MTLLLLLLANPVSTTTCRVDLVIEAPSPKGTPVYAKPNGSVIFTIPKELETFTTVTVIDSKKGWWKIDGSLLEPRPKTPIKSAWVRMSTTFFHLGEVEYPSVAPGEKASRHYTTPIYSRPTYAKKSGVRIHMDAKVSLVGCRGPWIKIRHRYQGKTTLGWWAPEDQCPNTVTNCHNDSRGEKTGIDSSGNR